MKKLLLGLMILTTTATAFSAEKVKSDESDAMQLLDLVLDVHDKYSVTSGLNAKVIELLAGDGANAARMVLSINEGYAEKARVFELPIMMSSVRRLTFLAKDVIVINYTQDQFDVDGDDWVPVPVRKSVKITLSRNSDGKVSDEITMEDFRK